MTTEAVPDLAPAADSAVPESAAPSNIVHLPDGHTVTLEPVATPTIALAIAALINEGAPSSAVMLGKLGNVYLDLAIIDWDYADHEGYKVPINSATIHERITVTNGAMDVSEAADGLYWKDVMVPLGPRLEKFSQRMRTASLIPTTSDSGFIRPKHSKRSSQNGTAGPPLPR